MDEGAGVAPYPPKRRGRAIAENGIWSASEDRGHPVALARDDPVSYAVDALNATFRPALTAEIEKAFGEVLERERKKRK